jgi:hypothetical protein
MFSTAADYPFQTVFMDYIGPLHKSNSMQYILVIIDRFSRYVELIATSNITAAETCDAFYYNWICSHGAPANLTTDGGSHFKNTTMQELCRLLNINHHITTAYHPESHGVVERANRVVMDTIRALIHDGDEWTDVLPAVKFAMNTSINRTIGVTPYEAVHGFRARLPIHAHIGIILDSDEPIQHSRKLVGETSLLLKLIKDAEKKSFQKAKEQFLRKCKGKYQYEIGDFVLIHFDREHKLALAWKGPYVITNKVNEVTYEVEDLNTHAKFNAHINRLHIFYA